jgi:thioester reductase-like protein
MSALPIQYADYTLWQREYLQGEVLNALVGYWGEKLAGVESPALPADRPWRAEDSHLRGERTFRVSAEIRGRLERICRSENVTLFMLMLAAYKVLLYRYGQSDHVAVAVPVANRNRPETQELIGLFMNTLILRSDFHDDCSFREALRRVRKTVLDGFDHQDLPIELMIRELHFDYQPARYPFTHVLFNYHQPATTEQFPGRFPLELSYRSTDLNPLVTRFALDLTFTETGRGLDGMLEYDTALFDAHTIERIEGHLHQLLEAVIADPDRRLSQLQPLGEGGHQQAPVRRSPTGTADLPQAREQRSTPGGTVNWNAEIQLDSAIRVTADLRAPATKPSHVLLTGATGFLGAYLLRELLRRTSADVYCLVRAPNPDEARKKILRNLEQYELRGVRSSSRINPICGDLARPMLGLADDEYRRLAETVDVIYHNGAYVNFVYPYPMLKAINVTGTVEVLRLATQSKVKPVHFVSTLSVFESPEYGPLGKVDERQPLEALASLQTGYAQSKCVAEKLVQAAAARGLPVVVCRPGRVTADSATGAESMADYTTMLFKLCIELGMAPPAGDTVEMTPVDYVARSIVALAQSAESLGRTFHLMNPRPVPLGDIYEAIRSCGYDLREVPLDVLRSQAIEFGARSKDESFVAFAHWLTLMAPPAGEAGSAPPALACDETVQTLEHLGVVCPRVDVESLRKLLAFLNRKRALPTPPRTGGRMNTKPPLEKHASDAPVPWSSQRHSLVPLRREGSKRPLFLIHGLGGYVAALVPLARGLAVDCPVYGLQAQGLDAGQTPHDSIGAMAEFYLREIRTVQPTGPYLIGGWSMGGVIALEAARQLGEAGEAVSLLALLDSYLSLADFEKLDLDDRTVLRWIAPRLKLSATELRKLPLERQWERIEEQAMRVEGIGVAEIRRLAAVCKAHLAAICRYVRQPYPGPAVLFTASRGGGNPAGAWSTICPRLRVEPVSGDHYTMLCKPDVDLLADRLGHQLREALGVEK